MNSTAGHKILALSLVGLLVFSISSFLGSAYGSTTEEFVIFVSNIERIKAQLELVEQSLNSNNHETAFMHSEIVGKLASAIEKSVRESNKLLADDLYLNLIDLPALVKANTKENELPSHISEGRLLLDKAVI
ncbi:MAG: hypothetical protein ACRD32_08160, partial [Nitrososphaerales archaeon]